MPGKEFYLWQVQSFTVRVALHLVDELNRALSDPRNKQDEELGGILFGHILKPGLTEVTGFEFIQSEHHRGTIFALGMRERERLLRRTAGMNRRSGIVPVGFFRTHLRPGLFLDQDDFALMSEAFSDPAQIALLIRRLETGSPNAGIFFWEEDDMDRRRTPQLFPFDSQILRTQGPLFVEKTSPAPSAAPRRMALPPIPKPVLGWSLAAVASLALLSLGFAYRHTVLPVSPERPLNLHVHQNGQALLVDWDRQATALQQASSAVLTINDGGTTQKLNLTRGDLQHGKVQFWPRSSDVSVRMDLTHQYQVGAAPAPPEMQPEPEPERSFAAVAAKPEPAPRDIPLPEETRSEPPRELVREVVNVRPQQYIPPPAPPPRKDEEPPEHVAVAERAATPPVVSTASAEPVAAAAPAPEVSRPVPESPKPVPPRPAPPTAPAPARSVSVTVSVEPRGSSEIKKVVSHVPLIGRIQPFHAESGSNFSPARPSRSLEPRVPDFVAENLANEALVDVRVSIDKHGAVRNAEVLSADRSDLASLAANSAESMSWQPARDGDRSVSSDVIVHYRFRPRN